MIENIIWDVECTFYKDTPELKAAWKKAMYEVFAEKKGIEYLDAVMMFDKRREETESDTKVFTSYGINNVADAFREISTRAYRERFIKDDPKLREMFEELGSYRNIILSNAGISNVKCVLDLVGLDSKNFEKIFTIEDFKDPKPSDSGFRLVLDTFGCRPEECVSVGDKESTDIRPAKELGMKTIIVWGKEKGKADILAETVYDVPKYIKLL